MADNPLEVRRDVLRPIDMQDVRLAVGEGKLSPTDVLAGCNAELRRRLAHLPDQMAGVDGEVTQGVVVLRFAENGDMSYHIFGDERIRVFTVDERSPEDRVYEHLARDDRAGLRDLIPAGSVIGSSQDERHDAIAARVLADMEGRPHLTVIRQEPRP